MLVLLTYPFDFRVELSQMLIQHSLVYPQDLLLDGECHIDDVELGEKSIRDNVPTAARRTHRYHQLHLLYVFFHLLLAVVPS